MRVLLSLAFATGFAGAACTQPLRFQQLSTAHGFTDNAITSLYQDHAGFLWVGTENGLNRYDGHHVWTWHRRDGLAGEHITGILQDRDGAIWAASRDGGLTRFTAEGVLAATHRPDASDPKAIASARLTCLFDLDDSTLMIGAERVPFIFLHKRTGQFTYWKGEGPITPKAAVAEARDLTDWCHYIVDVGDGKLAIGFLLNYEQWLVDRTTGERVGRTFSMDRTIDQTISDAVVLNGRLFGVGWQRRLHVHELGPGTARDTTWTVPDECTAVLVQDSAHLLVGTRSSGLVRLDVRTGAYEQVRHVRSDLRTSSDDRIRALLRDHEGRIWVGTRNGIGLYDPRHWWMTSIPLNAGANNTDPDLVAFSIQELAPGELTICTSEGIYRYTQAGVQHLALHGAEGPLQTTTAIEYADGLLVGAEQGIFPWDGRSLRLDPLAEVWDQQDPRTDGASWGRDALPSLFQVRSIHVDTLFGSPQLVMGVLGYGIAVLDPLHRRLRLMTRVPERPRSIGSNLTRKLVRDGRGVYWAATADGLYRWELDRTAPSNHFTAFKADGGTHALPANDVLDVLPDDRGRLWIGTRNGGLARWDGSRMEHITCPRVAGSTVHGLAFDRTGRLWCASGDGFEVLDTASRARTHVPVPAAQGIPRPPACTRALRDGRIAFVNDNTLYVFDPALADMDAAIPTPYLTDLRSSDRPALQRIRNGVLELSANEHMLTVAVSALELSPLEPMRFTLELEGVDPGPRFTNSDGSLIYASLPSGTYRLLARTVAPSGNPSAPVTIATIHKPAPLWQRWWFYALLAVAVSGLAFGVARYRYRQALKLQRVRDRIASDLHDEVGSSLSSITIGSQLAATLSKGESEQVRALLARIGETSSESLRSMSDIVWAIDPKNDQGEALVKRMRRIAQELLEAKGMEVSFSVSGGVDELKLPMNARKEIVLIYKEAVHNASKHSGAAVVQVSLRRHDGTLSLSVKDDGQGFDPALHPDGHGLGSMQRRAAVLNATLEVKSAPGMGTLVGLEIGLTRIRD